MEKPSFQIDGEILKLVDETAKKIGVSRSDFFRMAVNEKLYRLGVLSSNSNSPVNIGGA
jgi:metal-responsive CopG/Arc/MetJ family transcriptional regulator